jgi:putative transposase
MSRIARAVLEDVPHHITQRGNGRQVIFDTVEGRLLYLDLLRDSAKRFGLSIWAYCLMSNHIHLLAAPKRADSLARALGRIHADYAR